MKKVRFHLQESWTGNSYLIKVEKNQIDFETFRTLGDNLKLDEVTWQWRRKNGYSQDNESDLIKYQNEVSCGSYEYKTKECDFICKTIEDFYNWFLLYINILTGREGDNEYR